MFKRFISKTNINLINHVYIFNNIRNKSFQTFKDAQEYIKNCDKNIHKRKSNQIFEELETHVFHRTSPIIFQYDNDEINRVIVYTDGSCKIYKQQKIAGIGVYWGENCSLNVSEKYYGVQTNNRAEIAAVVSAVELAAKHNVQKLLVITDSEFVVKCMTKWVKIWKQRNWMMSSNREARCRDILERLDNLIQETKIDIKWKHVMGHSHDEGNIAADKLANIGANKWLQESEK